MNRVFQIDRNHPGWQDVQLRMNQHIVAETQAGRVLRVTVGEPKRNLDQNARLQAMCGDVARQVVWHGQKMSQDDWRHIFVASYRKGQRAVPGIDGGFVVLGASSKELTKKECADVIDIIGAFGCEHAVEWSDRSADGFGE
jgi:hypothetical protein